MNIGFSTGSIALGDFRRAVDDLNSKRGNVIELSALRELELEPLLNGIDTLDLTKYEYISVHAPSKLKVFTERQVIKLLGKFAEMGWPIIVHPDIIQIPSLWKVLGSSLCLENMDKRKETGRTSNDMAKLFRKLPKASFCFDIAHARQVDPTLMEGFSMIQQFRDRLSQLHVSEVNTESKHQSLTFESILTFSTLAPFIPKDTPIVLESPVSYNQIDLELEKAAFIFDYKRLLDMVTPFKDSSPYFYDKVQALSQLASA